MYVIVLFCRFCMLDGFQADKRFFTLLKKEFTWQEVRT